MCAVGEVGLLASARRSGGSIGLVRATPGTLPGRDGSDADGRGGGAARRGARVAARQPAVGVREGSAAALRRPRRRGRVRPRVAGEARRAAAGSASRGRPSTAVAAAGRSSTTSSPRSWPGPARPSSSAASASTSSARRCSRTAPTSRRRAGSPTSSTRPRSGASCSANPRPAATSRRCARAPRRSTAAGCSTVRRSGRATRSSPTGAGASRAPIPTRAKQQGISALVVDMHAPGVEVRPLRQITDESEFNEVFFTDVFVADDRVVGPEQRRLAHRQLDAHARARASNPRQLVVHAQLVDELLAARARTRRARRPPARAAARRGVRRGEAVPAPQLALDLAHREGPRPRAAGQHQQALVVGDEQAPARHRDGRARRGRAAVAGRDREPRRRRVAAVVALLPGELDLGGHQRDPAQHRRRTHPRPPPRAEAPKPR